MNTELDPFNQRVCTAAIAYFKANGDPDEAAVLLSGESGWTEASAGDFIRRYRFPLIVLSEIMRDSAELSAQALLHAAQQLGQNFDNLAQEQREAIIRDIAPEVSNKATERVVASRPDLIKTVIDRTFDALNRAGLHEDAIAFRERAYQCHSEAELTRLALGLAAMN